jgi:hypothetical protein
MSSAVAVDVVTLILALIGPAVGKVGIVSRHLYYKAIDSCLDMMF